jgi:DNA-binding XRE family transcriptional regulator
MNTSQFRWNSFSRFRVMKSSAPNVEAVPRGPLNLARSYNFTEKHEVIDEVRTLMQLNGMGVEQLARQAGVAPATIYFWFNGKTRRPQTPTLNAVGRVFGKRIGYVWDD